jgi:methylthioribose-1-phosphate isomerase
VHQAGELEPIRWQDGHLLLLDQTLLPAQERWFPVTSVDEAIEAIRAMRVRGAPAIGVAAAYALAAHALRLPDAPLPRWLETLGADAARLASARPTAVNLAWAVERALATAREASGVADARDRLLALAHRLREQDIATNRAIGGAGAELLPERGGVLTHCNTGALATAGYGTALGVIRAAWEAGRAPAVFCTETRPWLQGARLTAFELVRLGIPARLLADSAAGVLMAQGAVNAVVVGADRIAANGDTANKVGTYTLAVLAHAHAIPFYVAAPMSTVDPATPTGEAIVIEERPDEEVTHLAGQRIAAEGIGVRNPAFDVTPARLISAIITERGVLRAPYEGAIASALSAEMEVGA